MAPLWYRPVLRTQAGFLDLIFGKRQEQAAKRLAEMGPEGAANWTVNRIGGLSAERAAPGEVEGWVMAQHTARYAWALKRCVGKRVVDLGSGTGFGASMLDFVAESVIGVEIDEAGLAAARTRYPHVRFEHTDLCCDPLPEGDVATMFEVLEHLPDPEGALDAISSTYPRLLISFPNPLFAGSHLNPHHLVDWPLSALKRELRRRGGRILEQRQSSMRGMNLRRGAHAWSATWVLDVSFG